MAREKLSQEYGESNGQGGDNRERSIIRRSVVTREVINRIVEDARRGFELHAIAARVGVSKPMLSNWLRRGESRRNEIDDWADRLRDLPEDMPDEDVIAEIGPPPKEDDLLMLYDAVARALADGECDLIGVIRDDAMINGNVSAAKWLLTARYPQWRAPGRQDKYELKANDDIDVISAIDKKLSDMIAKKRAIIDVGHNPR